MKKRKYVIIFLLGFLFTNLGAQPVKMHGQLLVNGIQLVDQNGEPIILRGVSYGWHNWWPRFYNKESVKWLRDDWKATVVRAAMGVDPERGYIRSKEWSVETIEKVIDAAIENDIYVIVDWHSHTIHQKEAIEFFEHIARKYGDKPHVLYEIFNEPERIQWEPVKKYSIEVIQAIRSIDPDNIILVGSPHWCQDLHIVADDPIIGFDNLMYTVHFYAATHKQGLRDRCMYALSKGIPIFASETAGMEATGNGPINHAEWQTWIDWMEQSKSAG
ncbi:cellulase [Bacteroidales bacterium 6E]|nr:cellulase [Bacteroidales bacterium 6E]